MVSFKYFQSIVNYRVPIGDNGVIGTPEILNRWTTESHTPKKTKKTSTDITLQESGEVEL